MGIQTIKRRLALKQQMMNTITIHISIHIIYIKTSGSESQPRTLELMHAHSKINFDDYREYFEHSNKACICSFESQHYGSDIH